MKNIEGYIEKRGKQFKIEIQIGLSMLLLSLTGCDHKTAVNASSEHEIEEYTESSVIIENKMQVNDGIHLSNDAKSYDALEKEIDILMDDLPDSQ